MGFKWEQREFKLGQRLQIRVRGISNGHRDYKLWQGLQVDAEHL